MRCDHGNARSDDPTCDLRGASAYSVQIVMSARGATEVHQQPVAAVAQTYIVCLDLSPLDIVIVLNCLRHVLSSALVFFSATCFEHVVLSSLLAAFTSSSAFLIHAHACYPCVSWVAFFVFPFWSVYFFCKRSSRYVVSLFYFSWAHCVLASAWPGRLFLRAFLRWPLRIMILGKTDMHTSCEQRRGRQVSNEEGGIRGNMEAG
jgi:hypothetical protein